MYRRAISLLSGAGFLFVLGASGLSALGDDDIGITPGQTGKTTRVATRGANFLTIGVGARAQALGGAGTALGTGVPALYWNTAATAFGDGVRVGMSYSPLYGDLGITHNFGGIILPLGNSTVALSINTLNSGEMTATTADFPAGGDPNLGVQNTVFEWTSTAVGIHYSQLITDRLAVGVAGKYISEGISGASIQFMALDLSTMFELGLLGTTLAASYVNIGTESRITGQRVDHIIEQEGELPTGRDISATLETRPVTLPSGFYFGIASELVGGPAAVLAPSANHNMTLVVDGIDLTESAFTPRIGIEYGFRDIAFLRVGKQWPNQANLRTDFLDNRLSFGGGVRVPLGDQELRVDYAYTTFGQLDNVQVFSFQMNF